MHCKVQLLGLALGLHGVFQIRRFSQGLKCLGLHRAQCVDRCARNASSTHVLQRLFGLVCRKLETCIVECHCTYGLDHASHALINTCNYPNVLPNEGHWHSSSRAPHATQQRQQDRPAEAATVSVYILAFHKLST